MISPARSTHLIYQAAFDTLQIDDVLLPPHGGGSSSGGSPFAQRLITMPTPLQCARLTLRVGHRPEQYASFTHDIECMRPSASGGQTLAIASSSWHAHAVSKMCWTLTLAIC